MQKTRMFTRWIKSRSIEIFSIDLRSLAAFRIGMGLLLLADLLMRSEDIRAFYTDEGTFPRELIVQSGNSLHWSLHALSGSVDWQVFLFCLAGIFALMLLFGYKTKIATICSWILLASMHSRNYSVLQGGDELMRIMLFWSIFLPLGATWSLDNPRGQGKVLNVASAALLLQVFWVYISNHFLKTGSPWKDGSAIYYALNIDPFWTPFGAFLLNFPELLGFLTHFVYWFELAAPLLLFFPWYTTSIRIVIVILLVLMHAGIGLSLALGLFSWQVFVALLLFVPVPVWNWRKRTIPTKKIGASRVQNALVGLLMVYITLWNLNVLASNDVNSDENFAWLGHALRLDQRWSMFSPAPFRDDGWYIAQGLLESGKEIDVLTGQAINWTKPDHQTIMKADLPWRKYIMDLRRRPKLVPYYVDYLCRDWNERNELQVKEIMLFYMLDETLAKGVAPVKKIRKYTKNCSQS